MGVASTDTVRTLKTRVYEALFVSPADQVPATSTRRQRLGYDMQAATRICRIPPRRRRQDTPVCHAARTQRAAGRARFDGGWETVV